MKEKMAKLKTLDKYLIFSIAVMIVFSVVFTVIFCFKDSVPDTLITAIFSAFGSELFMCCMLKRLKIKKEETQ